MKNIQAEVCQEVSRWQGVAIAEHRFGGTEFQVNGREFGHLHGNYQADIPFTVKLRRKLVAEGKASLHHLYPNSGWISFYIHSPADVGSLIELLRLNYDRLTKHRSIANVEERAA